MIGPAEVHTYEEVQKFVDLSPFRTRFAGDDAPAGAAFDDMIVDLVKLVFREASLR